MIRRKAGSASRMSLVATGRGDRVRAMHEADGETRSVELEALGERLSALRLCEASALEAVRRSLEAARAAERRLTLFGRRAARDHRRLQARARSARARAGRRCSARVDAVGSVDAKLRLCELHERRGLTELEEAWLVRSLYREDQV